MSKFHSFNKFVARYLFYFSPLIIITLIWIAISHPTGYVSLKTLTSTSVSNILLNILGFLTFLWVFILWYFFSVMIFSSKLRESILTKLSKVKERDEREEFIVGRAAKATFLSTMALTIFMLLLSGFNIKLVKGKQINSKKHISISYEFGLLEKNIKKPAENKLEEILFSSSDYSLSKSSLLLFILFWHLISFHIFSYKLKREN
jgi:hypothetical protein